MLNKKIINDYIIWSIILLFALLIRVNTFAGPYLWYDELLSVTRIAGWNLRALENYFSSFLSKESKEIIDLRKFFITRPDSTIIGSTLTLFHQGVLPFYYFLLKIWVAFGFNSIWWLQTFSWLVSLLSVCIATLITYKLTHKTELKYAPYLVSIIYLLSPFHIIYSREIRNYSLITLVVLVSYYFYLQYKETSSQRSYLLLILSIFVGLHIHVLFWIFAIGCFLILLFELIISKAKTRESSINILLVLLILLISSIWTFNAMTLTSDPFHFSKTELRFSSWLIASIWSIASIFCDLPYNFFTIYSNKSGYQLDLLSVSTFIVIITSILWVTHQKSFKALGLLAGVPIIILVCADLILGGQRTTISRYLFISAGFLPIIIGMYFSHLLTIKNIAKRLLSIAMFLIFIVSESISAYSLAIDSYNGKPDPSLREYKKVVEKIQNLNYSVLFVKETASALFAMSPYITNKLIIAGDLSRLTPERIFEELIKPSCDQKQRIGILSRINDIPNTSMLPKTFSKHVRYIREYQGDFFELGVFACRKD